MNDRFEILFFPEMRCNLACSYCHFVWGKDGRFDAYGQEGRSFGRQLRWVEFLAYLAPFRPYTLELTGGEPTLYPDLPVLLDHLPHMSHWAITSNTLSDRVRGLKPPNCLSWTASWHGVNREKFLDNLAWLARTGFPRPSVSLVVRPDELDQAEADCREFGRFARVNLLRELNPGVDWERQHKGAWRRLVAIAGDHGANLVTDDIPPSYEFKRWDFCDAGHRYFCLMPDGTVYRCYSDAMLRPESALGNISDWRPMDPGQPCGKPCAGCATDYRQRKWDADRRPTSERVVLK